LDKTSIALLPVDKASKSRVVGRTGTTLVERIDEAFSLVSRFATQQKESWRVATGVRSSEVRLASALFEGAHLGRRVLGPHHTACSGKLPGFEGLLKNTDLLILNEQEYRWAMGALPLNDVHVLGPKLIVITQAERGGTFSLRGETGQFVAARCPDKVVSSVGAGDWFLGGLVHSFIRGKVDVDTVNIRTLSDCFFFAARVAAKKITMPGAANGPSLAEL
jgi:hypothetical protein